MKLYSILKTKHKKKNLKNLKRYPSHFHQLIHFVFSVRTSLSETLTFTGFGLLVKSISTGVACGLPLSNNLIYEMAIRKYNENKQNRGCTTDKKTLLTKIIENVYKIEQLIKNNSFCYKNFSRKIFSGQNFY